MNQEESLALFDRGQLAWNAWAEQRLAERRKLKESGDWTGDSDPDEQDSAARAWHDAATADFSGHKFKGMADFSGFVFPGETWFSNAAFSGDAWFSEAAFKDDAGFSESVSRAMSGLGQRLARAMRD